MRYEVHNKQSEVECHLSNTGQVCNLLLYPFFVLYLSLLFQGGIFTQSNSHEALINFLLLFFSSFLPLLFSLVSIICLFPPRWSFACLAFFSFFISSAFFLHHAFMLWEMTLKLPGSAMGMLTMKHCPGCIWWWFWIALGKIVMLKCCRQPLGGSAQPVLVPTKTFAEWRF